MVEFIKLIGLINILTLIGLIMSIPLLTYIITILLPKVIYYLLHKVPKYQPCKNPLVDDSKEDRYNEGVCRVHGCVTTARYYVGMPQATCRRCGHKNHCAQSQVKEWRLPDRYDK